MLNKTNQQKTKILLTLTIEQKKIISEFAKSKGLSLSAYLRLKALEEVQDNQNLVVKENNPSLGKIKNYLQSTKKIPRKYKDFQDFKKFHKQNYQS